MQKMDRLFDGYQRGHGLVLDFKKKPGRIAHHNQHGEEFLPPSAVLAAAQCNVIPCSIVVVIEEAGFKSALRGEMALLLM